MEDKKELEVTVPEMGDHMKNCVIKRWYMQHGDFVKKGDIIANLETDKISMDLETDTTGTLNVIAREDVKLLPGDKIATISIDPEIAEAEQQIKLRIEHLQQKNKGKPPEITEPEIDSPSRLEQISKAIILIVACYYIVLFIIKLI